MSEEPQVVKIHLAHDLDTLSAPASAGGEASGSGGHENKSPQIIELGVISLDPAAKSADVHANGASTAVAVVPAHTNGNGAHHSTAVVKPAPTASGPAMPMVTIAAKDVSVLLKIPKEPAGVKTILSPLVSLGKTIATLGASNATRDYYRLEKVSGVIKPGTMTMVIGPPGHGKTSYLRAFAGRLPQTSGEILYNGRSRQQALNEGCYVERLTQLVDQIDAHLPLLTVTETLAFANTMGSASEDPARVEAALSILGLEECKDTVLGNEFIRGVSGGQKRRVTIGEALVGDARTIFLDEYTNGLDTATSEDITRALRKWCHATGGSIVATLQQPTPGLFALYDKLVCLRDSNVVYDGPRADVLPYFQAMGYSCPSDVDVCDFLIDCLSQPRVAIERQRTVQLLEAQRAARKRKNAKKDASSSSSSNANGHGKGSLGLSLTAPTSDDEKVDSFAALSAAVDAMAAAQPKFVPTSLGVDLPYAAVPCVTTQSMVAFYHASPFGKVLARELADYFPSEDSTLPPPKQPAEHEGFFPSPEAHHTYSMAYSHSSLGMLRHVWAREARLLARNKQLIMPRVMQAIVMGLMYGSLYYQIANDAFFLRVAVLLICLTQVAFGNMVELPMAVAATRIVYKQVGARYYPSWVYVVAAAFTAVPLFFIECALFGNLIYWMAGNVADAGRFFTFFATMLVQAFNMSVWFRMLSAVGKDEAQAQSIAGPSTGVFMLFGGFFVTVNNMPVWMRWIFWISPFSWSVRSNANNEFLSGKYDGLNSSGARLGDVYLKQLDMHQGTQWIGWAYLYLIGLTAFFIIIHAFLLNKPNHESSRGTARFDDEPEMLDSDADKEANLRAALDQQSPDAMAAIDALEGGRTPMSGAATPGGPVPATPASPGEGRSEASTVSRASGASGASALRTMREALPMTPAWLSFEDIRYTVQVTSKEGKVVDKPLLRNISGYAEPGKLTALMGASGAGKTTLLDVLASRKSMGQIEGKILVNGRALTPGEFAHITGYVEQFDSLLAFDTVRETLQFAADLRLPADVPPETKRKIVDEVIEILDLTSIQDMIIGNHRLLGLSPSQLKRVNIGCELVANPAILFLDEPTTGLDSRAAQTVMRVVRRIARSGRAVICTIHQPSAELFYMFDRLVLLASGGYQIFFGDLGARSTKFVDYLEAIPRIRPIPERSNPASWMLEEIGVGVQGSRDPRPEDKENDAKPESVAELVERLRVYYLNSPVRGKAMAVLHRLAQLPNSAPALTHESAAVVASALGEEAASGAVVAVASGNESEPERSVIHSQNQRAHSFSNLSNQSNPPVLPANANFAVNKKIPSIGYQFRVLFKRQFRAYFRNPPMLFSRLLVVTILSVLFGLIYFRIKMDSESSLVSKVAAITVSATFGSLIHGATSLPTMMENRAVFYRERASSMYYPGLWALAGSLTELFWCAIGAFFVQIPAFFLIDLDDDPKLFFKYYFVLFIACFLYTSMSLMLAALAPTTPAAGVLQGVYFGWFFTFSGVAITRPHIPRGWLWAFRGLPLSHLTEALAMPQFGNCSPLPMCGPQIPIVTNGVTTLRYAADYIQEYLGFTFDYYWASVGWLALFVFCVQVLAFIFTTKLVHSHR